MGDFTPVLLEEGAFTGGSDRTISFGTALTSGRVVLVVVYQRDGNGACNVDTAGWSLLAENTGAGSFDDSVVVFGKVSDGTETSVRVDVPSNPSAGGRWHLIQIPNVSLPAAGTASNSGTSSTLTAGTATPGGNGVVVGAFTQESGSATFTQSGSWSILDQITPVSTHPSGCFVYQEMSTAGNPTVSSSVSADFRGVSIALVGAVVAGARADWDADGFGAALSLDDIGPYVQSWRITRGASPELTGGAQPGQMTLTLKNTGNRFNPENTSGTLYGKLRDGVPIWLGVNSEGQFSGTAVRGLFGGRIEDITPVPVPGATVPPTVEITATDALAYLQRTPVRIEDSRTRSHKALRQAILDAAGITSYTIPPEIETMPLSSADGNAAQLLDELNRATGTRHFIEPGDSATAWFSYVARDRHWHLAGTAQGTLAGTAHVDPPSGWRRSADTVINQQRVTFEPVTFTPATVTVWEQDPVPFSFTSAASQTFWVDFDDFVDSPTVDISYTGSTVTSTLTPFGETAKLVLTSGGTSTVSALSIEGALARRAPAESVVANNTTSQADPRGIRSGSDISGDYVGVLASARGLAEHVVWRFGSPQVRPTLTVQNWFPYQFDLDLFDLISFSSTELGVTSRLFEIVGLVHEGNHAGTAAIHHTATYTLQECRVQSATNWFQTDVHAPDGSAITGY